MAKKKTTEPKPVVSVTYFAPEPVESALSSAPEPVAVTSALVRTPEAYLGPCLTCGRGEQREQFCSFCQADYPELWAAKQGLVAGPQMTVDEQARTDRATDIVLNQVFGYPEPSMLGKAAGNAG